jgi:hypothetical protein
MAVGRISGQMLKPNLVRDGVDLAFETDLLYLDVVNSRIGVNKPAPQHDLDVNGTTKTTDLEVTNQFDIGNITITGGSNGQILSTDGNGNLAWTSGSGSTQILLKKNNP